MNLQKETLTYQERSPRCYMLLELAVYSQENKKCNRPDDFWFCILLCLRLQICESKQTVPCDRILHRYIPFN